MQPHRLDSDPTYHFLLEELDSRGPGGGIRAAGWLGQYRQRAVLIGEEVERGELRGKRHVGAWRARDTP